MKAIIQFLAWLFAYEEVNGRGRCPTYLFRWCLLSLSGRKAYLHHFVGNDWSNDLHDHPRRFISIGLWGGYTERFVGGSKSDCSPPVQAVGILESRCVVSVETVRRQRNGEQA